MSKIIAVVKSVTNGWDSDRLLMIDHNLKIGDEFDVERIYIGRSNTDVLLSGFFGVRFNSVMFNFVDEDKQEINIFQIDHDLITNTYVNIFKGK